MKVIVKFLRKIISNYKETNKIHKNRKFKMKNC